jgi:hypothetical protein
MMPSSSVEYRYADGSGNRYIIDQNSIEYIPVTLRESSSGTYSGGESRIAEITAEQFAQVNSWFAKGFDNASAQQSNREMLTGMITKISGGDSLTVILKAKAAEKVALESFLKTLLASGQK